MNHSLTSPRGMILIRQVRVGDAVPFRDLRLEALQDSPTSFSADYQKALNQPAGYWEDMLQMEDDEATIFVAEDENQLIGMTGIARGRSPKTRHAAEIWGVYVKREWRGLHIGEGLINSCLAWAKARHLDHVRLGVAASNTPAIGCYELCGFSTYGTEPRAMFYEGKYYDFCLMSRSLDDS